MRGRRLLLLAAFPLVVVGDWMLVKPHPPQEKGGAKVQDISMCVACGDRTVFVRGRLVNAETGAPLAHAYVLTLALAEWATSAETIAMYRSAGAEHPGKPELCAVGRTDALGRFDVLISDPVSETTIGGVVQDPIDPDPRGCVEALWIETSPGATPIVTPVGRGTWRRFNVGFGLGGTWSELDVGLEPGGAPLFVPAVDLGRVKVRLSK